MTRDRLEKATPDTWMYPPAAGWTYAQVKDLDLPFDVPAPERPVHTGKLVVDVPFPVEIDLQRLVTG